MGCNRVAIVDNHFPRKIYTSYNGNYYQIVSGIAGITLAVSAKEGKEMDNIKEKTVEELLNQKQEEAEELLQDEEKMERFLKKLKDKLEIIPVVGTKLACVPVMAALLRQYVKKEYTDIPVGTIISIICALLYVVTPIDLVPDSIPGVGYIDDAAVVALCWKLVESDVDDYLKWRREIGKPLD